MAVLQGAHARPRNLARARTTPAARPVVQVGTSTTSSTGSAGSAVARVRPAGLLLAAIMASALFGMVYLTQTLGTNAMSSETVLLGKDGAKLQAQITRNNIQVGLLVQDDEIRAAARRLKLKDLAKPVVLPAP
jgi:hypothetical protein